MATQPVELSSLKRHLKKFLVAALESSGNKTSRPALYRFYDPRVLRSTLPFFNYGFAEGMFGKLVDCYLCEGVRLAQWRELSVVGELYRYRMPQDGFLQKLTNTADLKSDTIALPEHTPLADQPATATRPIGKDDTP